MRIVLCAAALIAVASPAAAFDNTTCKTFLAGTWDGGGEHDMGGQKATVKTHSTYRTDGSFTSEQSMEMAGQTPMTRSISGTWDAKPGPAADSCEASITAVGLGATPTESGTMSVVLTVIDDNTVRGPDGNVSTRAAEQP
jgi:hypothetical protein